MNMAADNREIARQVVEAIGGRENIASFAHCATRLRIMVHDQKKIDQKKVEQIDKVKGAFSTPGNTRSFSEQEPSIRFLKRSNPLEWRAQARKN